jgi:hypothetical protein
LNAGEQEGGNEIVAAVIVLGFVVGCGVALMALQGDIQTAITDAGSKIQSTFTSLATQATDNGSVGVDNGTQPS